MDNFRIEKALEKPIRGLNHLFITRRTLETLNFYQHGNTLMVTVHSRGYHITIIEEGQTEFFAKMSDISEIFHAPEIQKEPAKEFNQVTTPMTASDSYPMTLEGLNQYAKDAGLTKTEEETPLFREGATREDPLIPVTETKRNKKSAPESSNDNA